MPGFGLLMNWLRVQENEFNYSSSISSTSSSSSSSSDGRRWDVIDSVTARVGINKLGTPYFASLEKRFKEEQEFFTEEEFDVD